MDLECKVSLYTHVECETNLPYTPYTALSSEFGQYNNRNLTWFPERLASF